MQEEHRGMALRVSAQTIVVNILLSAFKLFAGVVAHSSAMLADGVESLADILSTLIVIIGIQMASKQPDKEHPYGHERMECVAAIVLAVVLAVTGLLIGWGGLTTILGGNYRAIPVPGALALVAAAITILVKEGMYWYTRTYAVKLDSGTLMANAWHHRTDALSSIGTFAGILGARMGWPVLDAVACLVICAFIFKAAVGIFTDAVGKMTDRACDDETVEAICALVLEQEGVLGVDKLMTRLFGNRIYVDVEVSCDEGVSLKEAHAIAQRIHDAIEGALPKVKHCMVHVNPCAADR